MDKDAEIMRLRKELALLKIQQQEEAVTGAMAARPAASGAAKVSRGRKVEVIERRRPAADKQTELSSSMPPAVSAKRSSQADTGRDSRTAVIIVDEGRRRRSSVHTPASRSSTTSVDRHREPRYHSPRTSADMERRDFRVVEVTKPQPRSRKGPREVTKYKEVTVHKKGATAAY